MRDRVATSIRLSFRDNRREEKVDATHMPKHATRVWVDSMIKQVDSFLH